ncbi:MAG TPA: DUF4199 domain-containing protein [Saprospiraceae bacterium]|nr:DUF4199 domain-containing protein [Saprospiraceae bacterium]
MLSKIRTEIKWALIFMIVSLAWMSFERTMGWHGEKIGKHGIYTLFFIPIAFIVYYLALLNKKSELGGIMTWKEGFKSGIIIGIFIAILSPLTQFIVHEIISPQYFNNIIQYSIESGNITEEEARAYFNFQNYVRISVIQAPIAGAVTSAIISLLLRNK